MQGGLCILDKHELNIRGARLSSVTELIEIRITNCKAPNVCKSEKEINDFLDSHHFVV